MVTANSGADVPRATIVRPITRSETPIVEATLLAESTRLSAPFHKAAIAARRMVIFSIMLMFVDSNGVIISFFILPFIPISAKLFCKHSQVAFMPYGVVLKDERLHLFSFNIRSAGGGQVLARLWRVGRSMFIF